MKRYDPLFNLYQIESDEVDALDKEEVGLMAKILFNMEDIESINRDISTLLYSKQGPNEKYLLLLKTMIDSLEVELSLFSLLGIARV